MNGATAEPCVKTTRSPSRASITMMGPSHHFLRTRMNAHSSPTIPSFSRVPSMPMVFASVSFSVELEERAPVHVLAERRLVALVEQVVSHRQVVHVGSHEAEVGVVGRAHDRLAADVERGVDD